MSVVGVCGVVVEGGGGGVGVVFFFKQKTAYEIGLVTGVQTCALPISPNIFHRHAFHSANRVLAPLYAPPVAILSFFFFDQFWKHTHVFQFRIVIYINGWMILLMLPGRRVRNVYCVPSNLYNWYNV